MVVKFVRTSVRSIIPRKATEGSVGFDLFSIENKIVKAGCTALISTGIKMQIPYPFFGKIEGRSGVIDRDYRGEIQVILVNAGDHDFQVLVGMAIAQIIFMPCSSMTMVEVENLDHSDRGARGFGSSGI
ncbi:deoxyuridine 5'-triphosphate nucleotidohydrolase-like protein [Leptotrombidium deliense]|uniref:Deoxyuridine 5'-triphosphate nucleotidohydrolase n=1 Tax=Leptotrombidium deliense TaxID=299467 RepID=A0A443RYD4_9ACAR|nr:deoxyuridine 5'-triphosphate nucleotidohydrolase-like protein [Leptotrombidium deliense]